MVNQLDFFAELISRLAKTNRETTVLVNGMTGNVEGIDFFEDIKNFELELIDSLRSRSKDVKFRHLHGLDFLQKVREISAVDFFVAPLGTAALIPQALNIPGVVYNSPDMMKQIGWFLDVMPSKAVLMPESMSALVDEDFAIRKYDWGWSDNTRHSYSLDIEKAVPFCLSKLESVE